MVKNWDIMLKCINEWICSELPTCIIILLQCTLCIMTKKSFCLMLQIDGWRAKNSCICTMCHDPFLLLTKASQMSRLKLQLNDPVMDTLYFFTCKRVSNTTIFIFEKPSNSNFDLNEKYILSWYLKYFHRWLLWHIYETYLATGLRISMSC